MVNNTNKGVIKLLKELIQFNQNSPTKTATELFEPSEYLQVPIFFLIGKF